MGKRNICHTKEKMNVLLGVGLGAEDRNEWVARIFFGPKHLAKLVR